MKKIILAAVMLLISITSFAQSGEALYRKYSDEPGVSGVYISPAMFRMIGRLPAMNINDDDVDITPIIRSLSGFYLINSENPEVNEALRAEMRKVRGSNKYELLMEAKDDGDKMSIYTANKGNLITSLLFLAEEISECTFIVLDGSIYQEDLDRLLSKALSD